jgi:hypothetical protein
VTYTLTGPTGTVLLNGVSAPHGGDGWYQVTLDGTAHLSAPGRYDELWSGTAGSAVLSRSGAFLVLPPSGPLLTRLELRQQIADELGDLVTGTLTGASSLSLIDSERVETTNYWAGAYFSITSGNARDQERRLTASDPTGLLIPGKPWAVTPGAGDYYEGHRKYPVAAYNRAINRAILDVAPVALITVADETVLLTDNTYEYAIPAGFSHLAAVEQLQPGDVLWRPTSRARRLWEVIPGKRVLRLAKPITSTRLRLVGQMLPEELRRDGAYVDVDPRFLLYQACAHLLAQKRGGPGTDPDQTAGDVNDYLQRAQAVRPAGRPLPGSVRV